MKAVAAWAVYDYQTTDGGNPTSRSRPSPRPPKIKKLWHNSWRAQLGDLAGPIEASRAASTTPSRRRRSTGRRLARDRWRWSTRSQGLAREHPGRHRAAAHRRRRDAGRAQRAVRRPRAPAPAPERREARQDAADGDRAGAEAPRDAARGMAGVAEGQARGTAETASPQAHPSDGPSVGAAGSRPRRRAGVRRAQLEQFATSLAQAAEIIGHGSHQGDAAQPGLDHAARRGGEADLPAHRGRGRGGDPRRARGGGQDRRTAASGATSSRSSTTARSTTSARTFAGTVLGDQYVFCADGAHHNPDPRS